MTITTKLFRSNTTQAVRLPKAVAFDDSVHEVEVVVVGEARMIRPAGPRADLFWDSPVHVTADFLTDREQPTDLPEVSLA